MAIAEILMKWFIFALLLISCEHMSESDIDELQRKIDDPVHKRCMVEVTRGEGYFTEKKCY